MISITSMDHHNFDDQVKQNKRNSCRLDIGSSFCIRWTDDQRWKLIIDAALMTKKKKKSGKGRAS